MKNRTNSSERCDLTVEYDGKCMDYPLGNGYLRNMRDYLCGCSKCYGLWNLILFRKNFGKGDSGDAFPGG